MIKKRKSPVESKEEEKKQVIYNLEGAAQE
jgi:hypothetical protein